MGWLDYFRTSRKNSASIAKERLQIVVAHERLQRSGPDYLPLLQKDILEVIRKYVPIDPGDVRVNLEKDGDYSVLELNISLPEKSP
ncbi:MAG: cell division topological specificity factor MinE [Gammaproteobacteria bacterium]|jgi:cell division topological specificity factor|uniref:Cell division topological specificity factor n=1 Tax=Thioalbus denitrificans TaxID=547122 RepID=A0A369CHJ8_9GAMM|nr:cell division topological specificity factor MinE [Thioalbus denitrificans]MDD3449540.1 cell division topological specificity factor MinE [Gammaproteobacteria bacterium]RCX33550.1 cell division topological specificity factor MinE [Thioalbus denitrificans]